MGHHMLQMLDQLEPELDNIRRALEWALRVIGRRRGPERLDRIRADTEVDFSAAASAP